jgi:hypothetical protein
MKKDPSIFNWLREVEKRPGMYVGGDGTLGVDELRCVESMIRGYVFALNEHSIVETRAPDFLSCFGDYLRKRFGWSMSIGPIGAILTEARTRSADPWRLFFSLLWSFEESLLSPS